MAARRGALKQDIFANIAHIQCLESAANTLTYRKLETGISLFEKVAWVIHRLEYFLTAVETAAVGDGITCALCTSDNPSDILPDEASQVDIITHYRQDWGTAASGWWRREPVMKDFVSLPGGGLIVPPNPIYLAVLGLSQTNPQTVDIRIFYTAKVLKPEEYWELVEARRLVSSS
jgi:hypothetical protein